MKFPQPDNNPVLKFFFFPSDELRQSKKSISSAPFYHQLNSYRSASKIKFDKLNRVNKPSCVKVTTPENAYNINEIKSLKQRLEKSKEEIKSLRTIIRLMDEETPSQINKDVVEGRPWRVNKLKSKTKGEIQKNASLITSPTLLN